MGMEKYSKDGWDFWIREGTTDQQAIDEMYSEKFYDLRGLKNIHTVLDIGAHIGSFSVKAARMYPDAQVVAFEPMKENVELLNKNIEGLNVMVMPMAVYGTNPPIDMYTKFPDGNTGGTRLIYGKGDPEIPSVKITEVMDWFAYLDILKMDCEDGEFQILPVLDLDKIGMMIVEFHSMFDPVRSKDTEVLLKMLDEDKRFETIYKEEGNILPKIVIKRK